MIIKLFKKILLILLYKFNFYKFGYFKTQTKWLNNRTKCYTYNE